MEDLFRSTIDGLEFDSDNNEQPNDKANQKDKKRPNKTLKDVVKSNKVQYQQLIDDYGNELVDGHTLEEYVRNRKTVKLRLTKQFILGDFGQIRLKNQDPDEEDYHDIYYRKLEYVGVVVGYQLENIDNIALNYIKCIYTEENDITLTRAVANPGEKFVITRDDLMFLAVQNGTFVENARILYNGAIQYAQTNKQDISKKWELDRIVSKPFFRSSIQGQSIRSEEMGVQIGHYISSIKPVYKLYKEFTKDFYWLEYRMLNFKHHNTYIVGPDFPEIPESEVINNFQAEIKSRIHKTSLLQTQTNIKRYCGIQEVERQFILDGTSVFEYKQDENTKSTMQLIQFEVFDLGDVFSRASKDIRQLSIYDCRQCQDTITKLKIVSSSEIKHLGWGEFHNNETIYLNTDSRYIDILNIGKLCKAMPNIETLKLEGCTVVLNRYHKTMDGCNLKDLQISGVGLMTGVQYYSTEDVIQRLDKGIVEMIRNNQFDDKAYTRKFINDKVNECMNKLVGAGLSDKAYEVIRLKIMQARLDKRELYSMAINSILLPKDIDIFNDTLLNEIRILQDSLALIRISWIFDALPKSTIINTKNRYLDLAIERHRNKSKHM